MRSIHFEFLTRATRTISKLFAVMVLLASTSVVNALPVDIVGAIRFGGSVTGNTADIKDATSLTFGTTFVTFADGAYAADGIVAPHTATFTSLTIPLAVGGVLPLWTVVGDAFTWTFDLLVISTVNRTQTGMLGITGTGFGNSNDPLTHNSTDALWTLSADGSGMTVAFSSTTDVPEPASLALLGMGILGLAAFRRRRVLS